MSLNENIRNLIQKALTDGVEPVTKNGRQFLRLQNKKYRYLTDISGKPTKAGEYFYERSQEYEAPNAGSFDFTNQTQTIQKGSSEYILDKKNKQHLVRKWDGTKFIYTRLGKRYFKSVGSQYLVEIPVQCSFSLRIFSSPGFLRRLTSCLR